MRYKPKSDSSACFARLGRVIATLLTMMAAASLAAFAVPSAAIAAGTETRPAPQSATRPAQNAIPRLEAESLASRHGRGDDAIMGWWAMLTVAALLLAPAIGWCVPWRWLRIPLALLVAGPAWLAGGAVGSSVDGFEPMMGACCMGAVFWPVVNIGLSELFHYLRKSCKNLRESMRQERWGGR